MQDNKDEYVWHYTKLEAFLSIIKNKELWLSNLKYTNDPLEGEFSYDEFNRILALLAKKKPYKKIYEEFLKMDKNMFKIDSNIYSMSFSKRSDKMQHWQVYGDQFHGIAFRINVGKIKNRIAELGFVNQYLYYLEMKYQQKDLEESVGNYLQKLMNEYQSFTFDGVIPNIIMSTYNMALLQNKSEIFLGEDETRFALCETFMESALNSFAIEYERQNQIDLDEYGFGPNCKKFYFSKGLIKSRYSIALNDVWGDDLIDEVVIGPLCNQDKRELKDFLASCGLRNVVVSESLLKGKVRF